MIEAELSILQTHLQQVAATAAESTSFTVLPHPLHLREMLSLFLDLVAFLLISLYSQKQVRCFPEIPSPEFLLTPRTSRIPLCQ